MRLGASVVVRGAVVAALLFVGSIVGSASAHASLPRPLVTGVSPSRGPVLGGNEVAIEGTGFGPTSTVTFDGTASTSVALESPTRLVARVPKHAIAVVHIRVTTNGVTSAAADADRYRYVPDPTISFRFPPTLFTLENSGAEDDVSCPTTTFCVAVGYGAAHGAASRTYRGAGGWSAIQAAGGHRLSRVSCPTTTFCATVGAGGRTGIYDGRHWRYLNDHAGVGDLTAVSCSSPTFCMATDGATMLRWTGRKWVRTDIRGATTLGGVSCTSSRYCLAVSAHGYRTVWSGTRWSGYARIADVVTTRPPLVDCATPTFCAIVLPIDPFNTQNTVVIKHVSTYSPQIRSVTPPDNGNLGGFPGSVSCPSDDLCALGTYGGEGEPSTIRLFQSAAPQTAAGGRGAYAPGNDHVSCPTVHVCIGVGLGRSYRGTR